MTLTEMASASAIPATSGESKTSRRKKDKSSETTQVSAKTTATVSDAQTLHEGVNGTDQSSENAYVKELQK